MRKKRNHWLNKNNVIAEAKKYKTRKEFGIKANRAYYQARKNNWLDDVCGHMISGRKNKWDFNKIQKIALKYKTLKNFREECKDECNAVYNNGWLSLISHMKKRKSPGYYSKQMCKKIALKYKTKREFYLNENSAYQTIIKNKWKVEIYKHVGWLLRKASNYWTYNRCIKIVKKCKSYTEFVSNGAAYMAAYRNNWLKTIKNLF